MSIYNQIGFSNYTRMYMPLLSGVGGDVQFDWDYPPTRGYSAEAEGVCPASFIETEDWALEDPRGKSLEQVRKIRDEIKERIIRLLNEFK